MDCGNKGKLKAQIVWLGKHLELNVKCDTCKDYEDAEFVLKFPLLLRVRLWFKYLKMKRIHRKLCKWHRNWKALGLLAKGA